MYEATTSRIAPSKEKIYISHSILMVGMQLMVWLAASGMSRGLDNNGLQNLLCYKSCCGPHFHCLVNCSWEARHDADANYTLHFWYHDEEMDIKSHTLAAGKATFIRFNQDIIYALKNATIWVESHEIDSPPLVSKNLTLQISKAVKFDPPSRNSISISRVNNVLTLMWPKPKCKDSTMKKEARIKPRNNVEWTLRNCTSDDRAMNKLVVTCHLEKNIPYEAQIRFRTSDRSSHWSDWSEPVFIPAEILESPKVDYTIGQFGNNGLRNVTLEWEKPSAEHGDVHYSLTFRLLPCSCEEANLPMLPLNSHQTSYQAALSSAGYNVSLEVSNEAGSSSVHSLQFPPAQDAGTRFLNVSLSGRKFTLTWEAKMDTEVYCFEKQALGKALSRAPCDRKNLSARKLYESSGTVEFNTCYHLAVHGFDLDMDIWSTFGFTYLFARNTSLEDPIHINVINQKPDSAVIWWEPPKALSACPGKLKKYIICCQHEQDRKIMYYEANASETHYTILNLQPRTRYYVGIWAYTTESKMLCKALVPFLTSAPDPKKMTLALSFLCLFGGILAIICILHFGKKRVKKALCPALPDPANTEALKIFNKTGTVQVQPEQGLLKFLESSSLLEPFTVEVLSAKEEPTTKTTVDSLDLMKALEEPPLPKEVRMGSSNVLPSEYKGQGFLSPLEDDCHGREAFGEFAGISPEIGTGCSLLSPNVTEAGDSQDLPLPLAPLSFRLLNKLVVIKNGDSSCGFPCSDDVST
ncbi:interleukin-12 receptor subunit beta-1 [Tiliqua scincoides]|uniref:interleukin-12 receptor subunit beta-1 n=1 Tax=Tiliqua scincoides TaxID=71010 RepID=UPI0034629F9D